VPEKKINVLGNFLLDTDKYKIYRKKHSEIQHETIRLIAVGQLIKRKNHVFLLKLLKGLLGKYPYISLTIVGDGPESKVLKNMVESDQLNKVVDIKGYLRNEEVLELLSKSHIFVHTASMDQWPQVVNEAIATGLGVVVSAESRIDADFIKNTDNCFVVTLDESQKWIENTSYLIELFHENSQVNSKEHGPMRLDGIVERFLSFLNLGSPGWF